MRRRLHFRNEQTDVLENPSLQQPAVRDCHLAGAHRRERRRILEGETKRQRRSSGDDAVLVVGGCRHDSDVIERPGGSSADSRLAVFPDARQRPQRHIVIVRIEIENRLEEHERQPVEADRIVAKPVPRQPRILSASESVLRGVRRIRIVQIIGDRLVAPGNLDVPVADRRAVNPGQDVRTTVIFQRPDDGAGSTGGSVSRRRRVGRGLGGTGRGRDEKGERE